MTSGNSPLRCVVLLSGSASSLRYLKEHDPHYGSSYIVVGAISDRKNTTGLSFANEHGIPTAVFNFKEWCDKHEVGYKDLSAREAFFADIVDVVGFWQAHFILCSGFMLLITDPLLSRYRNLILNVHPADLSILDSDGLPKYRGLNVVERAMRDKAPTASTVHIITDNIDLGPPVVISDPLSYEPDDDPKEHQERMKTACDGPAYKQALEKLINSGWPERQYPWE